MTELFQTSLFGYSKKGVCAYIAEINEEFSQKLLEKDMACKDTVQALREQLEQLKQENEQLRAGRQEVAGALIDAKTFAADLMARAEAENRVLRDKNEARQTAEFQRLQALAADIDALRDTFRSVLSDMDVAMEQYRLKCQAIETEFAQDTPDGLPIGNPQEEEYEALA